MRFKVSLGRVGSPRQPQWLMRLPRLLGDKQPYRFSIAEQAATELSLRATFFLAAFGESFEGSLQASLQA